MLMQALPMLQAKFPIQRARMRLKLSVPTEAQGALLDELDGKGGVVESTDMAAGGSTFVAVAQVTWLEVVLG
jgi:ribosome maturation protein SDO1